jgi:hypothetical protein
MGKGKTAIFGYCSGLLLWLVKWGIRLLQMDMCLRYLCLARISGSKHKDSYRKTKTYLNQYNKIIRCIPSIRRWTSTSVAGTPDSYTLVSVSDSTFHLALGLETSYAGPVWTTSISQYFRCHYINRVQVLLSIVLLALLRWNILPGLSFRKLQFMSVSVNTKQHKTAH